MATKKTTDVVKPKRAYTASRESWGQLRTLPSGQHRATYVKDGVTYAAPNTFGGKADARAWLAGVRTDIERGKWKNPRAAKAELFGDYARACIAIRTSPTGEPLRPLTRGEYLRYLDKGLSVFCGERLDLITKAMVRSWHLKRSKAGKTAAALEARLLRSVMNQAIEDELIQMNPVESKLCRSSAGLKHRPPSEGELAAILATFETEAPQLRLAVLLAAYGGLRLSEWRALRRSDLELVGDRYTVHVTRQAQRLPLSLRLENGPAWIVGDPKSAEGVRVVTLPVWMTTDVDTHLTEHVKRFQSSLLFAPSGSADFLDDQRFNKPWNISRDRLGLRGKVREHDLRAFAGTYYIRAGATMREVQALLGHATADAALAYQHNVGDRAAELADRMPPPIAAPPLPIRLDTIRGVKG